MKKVLIASLAGVAALGMTACSEKTQDAAANTATAAGDDVESAADATVDATANGAAAVGNAVSGAADATANGAAAVEADAQDESKAEAKKD